MCGFRGLFSEGSTLERLSSLLLGHGLGLLAEPVTELPAKICLKLTKIFVDTNQFNGFVGHVAKLEV